MTNHHKLHIHSCW